MEKGFTMKSFVIVLAIVIIMVLIAYFVQKDDKNGDLPEENDFVEEIEEEDNDIHRNEEELQEKENDVQLVDEEDSDIARRAKNDLSQVLGIDYSDIILVETKEAIFSDYTLGTSAPGEVENQTLTDGYIVILSVGQKEYRYHINDNNLFFVQ